MDQNQIDRLALAAHALRPDWRADSLRTFIGQQATRSGLPLRDMPARDVAVAMTWIACDPDTRVPTRVLEAGPWWEAATPMPAQKPTPTPSSLRSEEVCQGCARDRAGHDRINALAPDDAHPWISRADWASREGARRG